MNPNILGIMFVKSQNPGEAHHTTRYEVTLGVASGLAAPNHPEAPLTEDLVKVLASGNQWN